MGSRAEVASGDPYPVRSIVDVLRVAVLLLLLTVGVCLCCAPSLCVLCYTRRNAEILPIVVLTSVSLSLSLVCLRCSCVPDAGLYDVRGHNVRYWISLCLHC